VSNEAQLGAKASAANSVRTHVVCPMCATSDPTAYLTVATIRRKGNAAGPYRILRCLAHGVEFADPDSGITEGAADQSSLDSLYGALDDSRPSRYVDFMDRIERLLGRPGALHDIGCGNGQLLVEAKRRGWIVQGNDLLSSLGPALADREIPYFVGELFRLDLPSSSFDIVSSFCVLPHHVADPLPDLRTVVRILRPGGWLIAELPDDGLYRRVAKALYRLSRGRWEAPLANIYTPGGHLFGYSRLNIQLLLQTCGFERVLVESYRQPPTMSTARFSRRGLAFRTIALAGTAALTVAGRMLKMPNHMVVCAQTPSRPALDGR
jgi:SAM-dependent methyltransferase